MNRANQRAGSFSTAPDSLADEQAALTQIVRLMAREAARDFLETASVSTPTPQDENR